MHRVTHSRAWWARLAAIVGCALAACLAACTSWAAEGDGVLPAPGTGPAVPKDGELPAPGTGPKDGILPAPGTGPAAKPGDGALPAPGTEPLPTETPGPKLSNPQLLARVADQLVVTNPVKTDTFTMGGVSSLKIPTGALHVLSRSPRAISGTGVSRIDTANFGAYARANFEGQGSGHAWRQGKPPYAKDPLATLDPPDGTGLKPRGEVTVAGNQQVVLMPGIYESITLSGSATVNLQPGRYLLKEGLKMSDRASLLGDGVLIINEGAFQSDGFGKFILSAPARGPFCGLVFYQPKENIQPVIITSAAQIAGTIYIPTAQLSVGGVVTATMGSVVADTVKIEGANTLIIHGRPFFEATSAPAPKKPGAKKPRRR